MKFSNTSSPYHSQTNGKADSAVKEAKKILLKSKKVGSAAFLNHRNKASTGIQISPAQYLLNKNVFYPWRMVCLHQVLLMKTLPMPIFANSKLAITTSDT